MLPFNRDMIKDEGLNAALKADCETFPALMAYIGRFESQMEEYLAQRGPAKR